MKKILFFILIIHGSLLLFSNDNLGTTLFSMDLLGEDDLYLSLNGSWKFDLSTFADGNISSVLSNFIFTQTPNISASIWLFNKYFFETNITEDSNENIFLLGYQNQNGILQEVRIGNDDLNINSYATYTPPINTENSPGTRFKIKTEKTTHELLGRYTNEVSNSVTYRGYSLFTEQELDITNYNKGRYFILPFENLIDINLYVKLNGEISLIDEQNFIYYKSRNLLYINELDFDEIYLTIDSLENDEVLTDLMDFIQPSINPGILVEKSLDELSVLYTTEIDDVNYLKLYSKGVFSPFEHLGTYEFTNLLTDSNNEFYIDNERSLNFILKNDFLIIEDPKINYKDLHYRYPFMDLDPDIYGTEGRGLNSETTLKLLSFTLENDISVPSTAKENSLIITINGITYQKFEHNSDSGVITFEKEISPYDEIVINYKSDVSPGTGNLLLSYGSSYNLSDGLNLELSNTGSWDFSTDDISNNYNENVGKLNTYMKLDYTSEHFSSQLISNLRISNPDTLGNYLLFGYDQNIQEIPINSTEILATTGDTPLIKRVDKDIYLSIDEIKELEIDPLGGAYYVNNIYKDINYKIIVIETPELTSGHDSTANIGLGEYQQDLSWAKELNLEIYNQDKVREVEIKFINPDIDSDENLLKTVTLQIDEKYKDYNINFSRADRSKLTNIDEIQIRIIEGPEMFFLLKGIEFIGDDIITHNSSENFSISKNSDYMEITSNSLTTDEDIIISSPINTIDLKNYGSLSFVLENSGLLDNESTVTMYFKYFQDVISTLTIPAGDLIIGKNSIKVDISSKEVYLNNTFTSDIHWEDTDSNICNFFMVDISEFAKESSLILSTIVLSDPILEFYNQNSLKLTITPDLDLKIGTFEVLNNLNINFNNYLFNSDELIYRIEGDLSFILLGSEIDLGISFQDDISSIDYTVNLPLFNSHLSLLDSFYYNDSSHRNDSLIIDTSYFDIDLILKDTTGSENGVKTSILKTKIQKENLFSIIGELTLTQERDDSLGFINEEIINSYIKLIPNNTLDIKNTLISNFDFKINTDNLYFNTSLNGELYQKYDTERVDNNIYNIEISSGFTIGEISITPTISTKYRNEKSSDINSITAGIEEYKTIFEKTNPFSNMDFIDIFFTENISSFYNNDFEGNIRGLDSIINLSISNSYSFNNSLDIIIPESISYSLNKSFLKEESNYSTNLTNSFSADFTLNNIVKNSLTFNNVLNIENSSNTSTLEWKLIYYKELESDISLDISNDLGLSSDGIKNVSNAELTWPGKSGPLLIIPIIDKVFDSPYSYTHKEGIYFNIDQLDTKIGFGIRHETVLSISDINETSFYAELGYKTYSLNMLNFETGIFTTIIF